MLLQPSPEDQGYYRIIRESNKIQLRFLLFPQQSTREALKQRNWRWSPEEGCWWAVCSTETLQFVKTYWKPAQPFGTTSESKQPSICSGKNGDGVVWQFVSDTLFIFGFLDVAIPDVSFDELVKSPWHEIRSHVKHIRISDGVGRIGKRAFYGFTQLESVSMGNTITSIGARAFSGCNSLSTVELSKSLRTIESQAFRDCISIKELYIPASVESIAIDTFRGWSNTQQVLQFDPHTQRYIRRCEVGAKPALRTQDLAFGDFVVLSNKNRCLANGHEIEDVLAKIYILGRDGSASFYEIPAGYCHQCNQYFIETFQYERLRAAGIPLCRVIKNIQPKADGSDYYKNLNEESILRQFGYNVNQQENLSEEQRQTILACLMESGICNRHKITGHLSWLIRNNEGKLYMDNAVSKWTDDRSFAENYSFGSCRIVEIRSLRIKETYKSINLD